MPIYNENVVVSPLAPVPAPDTNVPILETASNYSNLQYRNNTIGYIDGTPWTILYYAQFLGNFDLVANGYDVSNPTLKHYMRIDDFELRVTSALTNNVNAGTGTSIVTGEANVYPVFTPTVGDLFIGLIQDNIYGIFEVTTFTRLSLYQESAWSITYTQVGYSTPEQIATLNSYVVCKLVFDVKRLDTGSNPLLTESESFRLTDKTTLIQDLVETYHTQFYDLESQTFLIPDDPNNPNDLGNYYDPFIVKLWNLYISHTDYSHRQAPIEFDISNSWTPKQSLTIVDAILTQSEAILKASVNGMVVLPTRHFDVLYQRHTLLETNIDNIIMVPSKVFPLPPSTIGNPRLLDPYIFSLNFYNGLTNLTPLEAQLTKLIKKEAISYSDITPLVTAIQTDTLLNQFYYTPFIILLLMIAR